MRIHPLTSTEWMKAIAVGLATALLLSAVMVRLTVTGISPMPKPLGLAFAQTVLGEVPLPVGLLFHVAYVTIWSVAFVVLFRDDLSFVNALLLGLWLWVVVLVAFFPIVGWGFPQPGARATADCGIARPAPAVCIVPMGRLSTRLQDWSDYGPERGRSPGLIAEVTPSHQLDPAACQSIRFLRSPYSHQTSTVLSLLGP